MKARKVSSLRFNSDANEMDVNQEHVVLRAKSRVMS